MEPLEKNENPEENLVFEDLMMQANNYTYGATSQGRTPGGKKLTVLDLMRVGQDEDGVAPNVLPHTMSTFVDNLGDVYIKLIELQEMVAQAYKSSLAKDTVKIKKALVQINKNLQKQKKIIKHTGKLIDKLS